MTLASHVQAPPAVPVSAASAAVPAEVRGEVRVRQRAFEKSMRHAAAMSIGVPRGDVHVEVAEWQGGLAVHVAARLPIPNLADTEAVASEQPILERVQETQQKLQAEFTRLAGRKVRRVSFTVTGARVPERRRVA